MWKYSSVNCTWQFTQNTKCPVVFLSYERISQPVLLESQVMANQRKLT